MHITFTTPQSGPLRPGQGGIETLVIGWSTELSWRGHQVTVASLSERDHVESHEHWTAVESTTVSGLRRGNPDIVISNNRPHHQGDVLFMHNPAAPMPDNGGLLPWPPVGHWDATGRTLLESGSYKDALDAVGKYPLITCSHWLAGRLTGLTGTTAHVVHPHADPAFRAAVQKESTSVPVIQYVGRLVWRKGLADLAGMALSGGLPGVLRVTDYAHVSEPADTTRIRNLLQEAPQVELVPAATNPCEVSQLMAGADVVVVPSREESFGMVSIEAQASGTPVVAYDDGG